jgi:hypothetical protein
MSPPGPGLLSRRRVPASLALYITVGSNLKVQSPPPPAATLHAYVGSLPHPAATQTFSHIGPARSNSANLGNNSRSRCSLNGNSFAETPTGRNLLQRTSRLHPTTRPEVSLAVPNPSLQPTRNPPAAHPQPTRRLM